jgi:hypothetical protein
VTAHLAPLNRELMVLVPTGSLAVGDTLADGRAEVMAEHPTGDYLIRVKARCVPGRRVAGEPRRPELTHRLPHGATSNDRQALRHYPVWLEFSQNKGGQRSRAMGPIPGLDEPTVFRKWGDLAYRRIWPFIPIAAGVPWLYALFFHEATDARWFAAIFAVPASLLLLASVGLFEEWARFVRWREGIEPRAEGRIAEGWEGAEGVRLGAGIALGVGLFVAMFTGGVFGWDLAAASVIGSGLFFLGPFFGIRHLLRRADASEGSS